MGPMNGTSLGPTRALGIGHFRGTRRRDWSDEFVGSASKNERERNGRATENERREGPYENWRPRAWK